MGKQSRLRSERRLTRELQGRPTEILRELFHKIRCLTYESPRRCWELMLEILADRLGINRNDGGCLSHASALLLDDIPNIDSIVGEYWTAWDAELQTCKRGGLPVTDPIGNILEENDAGDKALDQSLAPPDAVYFMNRAARAGESPREWKTALDPWCGTGRIALDAVVHHPNAITYNIDVDVWMVRAALVNFYAAVRHTSLVIERDERPSDSERLFSDARIERVTSTSSRASKPERLIAIGGRTWAICADSFMVDLMHHQNWRYSWQWNPPPWQTTMKVAGFDGTYVEWLKARPQREIEARLHRPPAPSPRTFDIDLDLGQAELHSHMLRSAKSLDRGLADIAGQEQTLPFSGPRRISTLEDGDLDLPRLFARRSP